MQEEKCLLKKEHLLDDFTLRDKDTEIDFSNLAADIFVVDVGDSDLPKYRKLNSAEIMYFREHFSKLAEPDKREEAVTMMAVPIDKKYDALTSPDVRDYVSRILANFTEDMLDKLAQHQAEYIKKIAEKIKSMMDAHAQKTFMNLLSAKKIFCRPHYHLPPKISPLQYTKNIDKSLYEAEDNDINGEEHRTAVGLASLPNIIWWHRNIDKKEFFLNGFINHYPDFLAMTKSGVLLAVETKGDDRDNPDSRMKLELGQKWADMAGDKYAYFMVFNKKHVDKAYTFDEFMQVAQEI